MADVKKLPDHLKAHAESMPKDLRDKLSDEELAYRLRHVHRLTEDAAAMPNPALSRQLTAHAKKFRDALPYYDYSERMRSLEKSRDDAGRAGMLDIQSGYFAAIEKLKKDQQQAPGIGEYLRRIREYPTDESAGDGKSASPMLFKQARIDRLVKAELKKYEAKAAEEANRIRKEIQELKDRRTA